MNDSAHTYKKWIWLSKNDYPTRQETIINGFASKENGNYTVAEFKKEYKFKKVPRSIKLCFSADTLFQLYINGEVIATGPACVGGDFIGNERVRETFYTFEKEITPSTDTLDILARVQMMPERICHYSMGHGGFMLTATAEFDSGKTETFGTDKSWLSRVNKAYAALRIFDLSRDDDDFKPSDLTPDIWHAKAAPIPPREERELFPKGHKITLLPGEERDAELEFDMIYAGFLHIKVESQGEIQIGIKPSETGSGGSAEKLTFSKSGEYRGFFLHSAGQINARIKNDSKRSATVDISLISTNYPVYQTATTTTSDKDIDLVLNTCRHTLKICRQTHHLDSPTHCEPLACTGDYYIESLMTIFSFGDMRLAEFDIMRTADMLKRESGRMFHTTYSLIFVKMLYDVHMATGNTALLEYCAEALHLLFARFETYIGDNGLIETPPDYMFIDWIYIDELSMHHPPKALGQSCLNMYYFAALDAGAKIFRALGDEESAKKCEISRENVKKSINKHLFDKKRGIYFEGLNTPTDESLLAKYMPQNVSKRYYMKHSNILAACFGVCDDDTAKRLIEMVMENKIDGDCQPYFLHFLFEAIFKCGLREKYTLKLAERWKAPTKACPKGLVEGFIEPEPTYRFDHSHAWGGTPLYSLPKALLGLKITEPGMKKIELSPSLLGLESASVELLTPAGLLKCEMEHGKEPKITAPHEITIINK